MASKKEKTRQRIEAQKRKKRAARICGYILAAIVINGFIAAQLYSNRKATPENTTTKTITMDNVVRGWHRQGRYGHNHHCYVVSDGTRYLFTGSYYATDELCDMLCEGDSLTITYLPGSRIFGYGIQNRIVAATYNGIELASLEHDNEGNSFKEMIEETIFYFLATGVFSFVLVCSEGFFMQWIRAGSQQRKLEAEQRHKANIAANKAEKAKK